MRLVGVGIVAGVLTFAGSAWASATNPADSQTSLEWNREVPADQPVHLIVSVPEQQVDVYVGGKLVANSRVSTGQKGYSTPTGVFSILQKKKFHRSNIYSRAPMPFMQRLTWSGIALHASNHVPDYPASHGCVRLPPKFAKALFGFTGIGAHVIISGGATTPVEVNHPNLLQPLLPRRQITAKTDIALAESVTRAIDAPPIVEVSTKAAPAEAEAGNEPPVRILVTRRTGRELVRDVQTLLKELGHEPGDIDGWMGKDTGSAVIRFQKSRGLPTTGAMSEKLVEQLYRAAGKDKPPTGHLYVRRDFAPVFDVPVTIAEPETPLGSHLFTAMSSDDDASEMRWLAVTINERVSDRPAPEPKEDASEAAPMPSTAKEALDRIEIPVGVRRWISRMLTPGSSFAISDDGISRETLAKGTDFVVLTR